MNKTQDLTVGNEKKLLTSMTMTMVYGTLATLVYVIVDTIIVGQLGETQLAVLGFAYPVTLIMTSVIIGLSIGTSTSIAFVAGDRQKVMRLVTDGLFITMAIIITIVIIGLFSIKPIFYGMGATDKEMPYIVKYMTLLYLSVPMIAFATFVNYVMRALGNTKVTAAVSTMINIPALILDPLLVLGLWFFPKMGIVGAGIALIVGRTVGFIIALYFIIIKTKLLSFNGFGLKKLTASAKKIMQVAIPCTITKSIVPVGAYFINGMLAVYGSNAVAGYGAGTKVEAVVFNLIAMLALAFIPFAGQNFGAGKLKRLQDGFNYSLVLTLVYSVVAYALLFFAAPYLARLFGVNAVVIETTVLYIRIAIGGLIFQGGVLIVTSGFNAVGKPLLATGISVLQVFVLYIPLAYVFSKVWGPAGIFVALVVSYAVAMAVGYIAFKRFIQKRERIAVVDPVFASEI